MKKTLFSLAIALSTLGQSYSQTNPVVSQAQLNDNVLTLIDLANSKDPAIKAQAEKALLTGNWTVFSYETADTYYQKAQNNPNLEPIFKELREQSKLRELNSIKGMDLAEIKKYQAISPQKAELANETLNESIYRHKEELSLDELNYICSEMRNFHNNELNQERTTRIPEIQDKLKDNVNSYIDVEKQFINNINYLVEKSAFDYLYSSYKHIAQEYSQVTRVPGNVDAIEQQYRKIVEQMFSSDEFRKYLEFEVNKFCDEINASRELYSLAAGYKNYKELALSIPEFDFANYSADDSSLVRIVKETREYLETRQTVNKVAGYVEDFGNEVGSWFGFGKAGTVVGAIGKTAANWYFSSEMVDNIANARRNYMTEVLSALEQIVSEETNSIQQSFREQINHSGSSFGQAITSGEGSLETDSPAIPNNNTAREKTITLSDNFKEMKSSNTESGNGKYPFTSQRRVTEQELSTYSKAELKIMRNEIFARHGYRFQTQEMKTYFGKQSWHKPKYDNVNHLMSDIEKKNVETIKKVENKK